MNVCDVIVVGAGTVGAATCMTLARRGVSVLGLDSRQPPHQGGSHHGRSRSIRRAYLEGSAYVPMAMRAWELWRELEDERDETLLVPTGNLTIGTENGEAVAGFLASARTHGIPHELLTAAAVRNRWPALALPEGFVAGLESEAGVLFPEACITAMLSEAQRAGATLRFNTPVLHWHETEGRVQVQTPDGCWEAGRLLLAAGAENPALLKEPGLPLKSKRVPVLWIDSPVGGDFELGRFPVNFWQFPDVESMGELQGGELYTLPVTHPGGQIKAAAHNLLMDDDPQHMPKEVEASELTRIIEFLTAHLPVLAHRRNHSQLCRYATTPDRHFILGPVPGHDRVFTAALAGHGFKFATVLGEVLADMLQGKVPAFDTQFFSANRF